MPESKIITFTYKEIVTALVKEQNIHEGIWGLYFEFGISGVNINTPNDENTVFPAAVVPIVKVGIQRFPAENSITVDAAKVNPAYPNPETDDSSE